MVRFKPCHLFVFPVLAVLALLCVRWSGNRMPLEGQAVLKPQTVTHTGDERHPCFVGQCVHAVAEKKLETTPELMNEPLTQWAKSYVAASPAAKEQMLEEGIALARDRRGHLLEWIQHHPREALLAALPKDLHSKMPDEVAEHLEVWISARAPLEVMQACLHPNGAARDHSKDFYRASVIDDQEYRVYVYGSRIHDASLRETSLHGIAIDGHLAVSDSRMRLLDAEELLLHDLPPLGPNEVVVEANGELTVLASREDIPDFEKSLLEEEFNPVIVAADAGQGASGVSGRPTQAWTHGDKKLLVIRVDFSDLTGTPINKFDGNSAITEDYVNNVINGANGVSAFMRNNSYNKSDIIVTPTSGGDSPDITQVFRMPSTASSYATANNNSLLHSDARSAATSAGYDLSAYDRICVVFTYLGDLAGSQIDYGGLGQVVGPYSWINGAFDLRVVAHELGHNHGLNHANFWQVSDGNPVSASGTSTEYGDPFDLMGGGNGISNHFTTWNKALLQWIPDSGVTLADVTGTYRIYRFDHAGADLNQPRALKIVRDSVRDYWIGYRRATSSTYADNGATVIWGYNSNQQGNLLDLTTTGSNSSDAPLAMNVTFNDNVAGIAIKPVAQGGSGSEEWLDVEVTLQPRLRWEFDEYLVNEQGGSAVLKVTRSNNSNGAVSVNYATASDTAISGSDFTHTSGTLNWSDGDTSAKTVTVPIVADSSVEGTESFTVTLSSVSGGVLVEPAAATVIIADPGSRDPKFASDFINNSVKRTLVLPDDRILIAGLFDIVLNSDVAYYHGRISRLHSDGAIDTSFDPGTGANADVYALARQPDGKILIGGNFTNYNGTSINRIARLHPDGGLDTSFDVGSGANAAVRDILPLPDGKILVGGGFNTFNGSAAEYLVRLEADGSFDTSFTGPNFQATSGWSVNCLALQPDGKYLVGGSFYLNSSLPRESGLCRLLSNGSRDSSFNGVGHGAHADGSTGSLRGIEEIEIQQDGKIIIAGGFTAFNNTSRVGVARLSSTGVLESGFDPQLDGNCNALLLLPDQSILIGGSFTNAGATSATRIARLSSSGAVDVNFAAAGGHAGTVENFDLQADGNVVLGGAFNSFQGASPSRPMWRFVPGLSGTPGVIQFAADAAVVVEGTNASINVVREGGTLGALTIGYSTVEGSATGGGTDFTTSAGNLTWSDGDDSTKSITVPISADGSPDTPESFLLNIGEPKVGGVVLGERQQINLTVMTAYGAWAKTKFTQAELDDLQISGDDKDPDADGLDNLLEYALNKDPKVPDSDGAWTPEIADVAGTKYLTLTFRRLTPSLDIAYTVQTQGELNEADWEDNGVLVGSPVANGDGTETVTYRDVTPSGSADRRFMRVKVTRTP